MPLGNPSSMSDAERTVWIRQMLQELQGAGGQLPTSGTGYDLLAPGYPAASAPVNVGVGQKTQEPGLLEAAGVGSAFGGARGPAPLPIDQLSQDVPNLDTDKLDALQQLIVEALSGLNRRRMGQ